MNVVARGLRPPGAAGVRGLLRPATGHVVSRQSFRRAFAVSMHAPGSGKLERLVEDLKSSKDIQSIHHSYSVLATEISNSNGQSSSLSLDGGDSILSVLQSLAASGQPEDIRIIENLLSDLSPILGLVPSKSLYTSILQAFVENGREQQAHAFLLGIPHLAGHLTPTIEQFNLVLESCNDLSTFTSLISAIEQLNLTPTSQTFSMIFQTRTKIAQQNSEAVPSMEEMTSLISNCVRHGLTYDPAVVDMVYEIYATRGQNAQASAILDLYQSILSSRYKSPDTASSSNVASGITEEIVESTPVAFDKAELDEKTPPAEKSKRTTVPNYNHALTNCLVSGNAKEAVRIYTEAATAGAAPLNSFKTLFLEAITRDPSSEELLDKAISVSRVIADSVVPIPSDSNSKRISSRPYGPGLSIYHGVLRALFDAPNTEKYSVVIAELMDEMKTRGLPINTSVCASANIILDMRRTNSFEKSWELYREYRPKLNEYGFGAVLKEYCRISFAGDLEVPLITGFFSIVQDMRLQQVPITNVVYMLFLNAITTTAKRIKTLPGNGPMTQRLIDSARRLHDFLTVEASVSPDATLWNQLMNTYQHLGCFGEACRLWEVMFITKRYNQISVNIMIDACGYARNIRIARSILSKLERARFKLDLRNWNTWVECLCRDNRFDEATDVVIHKIRQYGHEPDLESLRILLKFAKRLPKEQGDDICKRLKEGLPHLWKRVAREILEP